MINPTEADIGRAVIYKGMYDDIEEEGILSSIGEYAMYVRFGPPHRREKSQPIACPRACLSWKEEDPCPPNNPPAASSSPATPPDAPKSGIPLTSESGQRGLNSSTIGVEQRPKDGDVSLQEQQIREGIKNGLIDAPGVAFRLPGISKHRPEYHAYLDGFNNCLRGVARALNWDASAYEDIRYVAQLTAKELYPDYDPTPEPMKRTEDGRRRDGIKME
jgi:hypothetical protein